ncbi:MAG: Hpt domain-containing protein [Sphingomonas sp.]|nr:Hpt domain-containing protein [Sphingomonas sp.]
MENAAAQLVVWTEFQRTRAELGANFVRILSYFREDGEKAVGRIEEAMHERNVAALVLPAHTMKSEARQFGAEQLGMLAEEIEVAARRALESHLFPDHIVPEVAKLRPLYLRTIELLERETNPLAQRRRPFGRAASNQDFGRL